MHSRVSNQAHGARRREFRATERDHSRGEIAAAGSAHFEPACQLASYYNFQFATHLGHELCLGWLSKDWQVFTFLFPCQPPRRPKLVRLINRNGCDLPYFPRVLGDCAVAGELARSGNVQDNLASPCLGSAYNSPRR